MAWETTTGGQTEEGLRYINTTELSDDEIRGVIARERAALQREISNWVQTIRRSATPSVFNRAAYVAPDNPFAVFETAHSAVDFDDVISGVCDTTEGLMIQKIKWEGENSDDADVFNQINRDLDMDDKVRQWHREDFTYSQVVVGLWWGRQTYTVRGKTPGGNKKKKKYQITCPVGMTFLNPMMVIPMQPGPFGQDRLAWQMTKEEYRALIAGGDGSYADAVQDQFLLRQIDTTKELTAWERMDLTRWGVNIERLFWLNPDTVFRACRSKMSYERFPSVRLKSTFALLDMKQQLLESDRVMLVGATNYILLVTQGSKEEPAMPEEIANLKENFRMVAKLPVVVGDHRLKIEIITPKMDHVLNSDRYDTIDRRLMGRALGALEVASNGSQRSENSLTIARGVGRLLENRRHMMKREIEKHIARAIVNHPDNAGIFDEEPNLVFTPRNIQLDSDAQIIQAIMELRQMNELSRESTLEYFGFDETAEALRVQFEEDSGLNDIFKSVVPFSSPALEGKQGDSGAEADAGEPAGGTSTPGAAGRQGGRPTGGGTPKKSVQGRVKPQSGNGNPST
jgi:hypothetical protein